MTRPDDHETAAVERLLAAVKKVPATKSGEDRGKESPNYPDLVAGTFWTVARHRAAAALVAAARQRLDTGAIPATAEAVTATLVPPASRDPFTADRPPLVKRTDDALLIYSVGPDGEDDGGPVTPGEKKSEGNDDVGLRMAP